MLPPSRYSYKKDNRTVSSRGLYLPQYPSLNQRHCNVNWDDDNYCTACRVCGPVATFPQSALTKAAESFIQYMNRAHRRRLTYKLITEMPLEVLMKPTIRSQNTITCPSSRQKCWSLTRKKKIHAKSERRFHCLVSAHASLVVIDNDHQIIIIILMIILEICTAR